MITSLVLFYIAGIMALVMRAAAVLAACLARVLRAVQRFFTMHGSLMLYLFAGPFAFGGLANYIVPLQVGAPDMAFPPAERPVVLAVPHRLDHHDEWGSLVAGGAASFRLGRLRAPVQRHQLTGAGRRHLDHGPDPDGFSASSPGSTWSRRSSTCGPRA